MDINDIAQKAASKAAEELDEHIPDGIRQKLVGNFMEAFGKALAQAGKELAGVQNKDGDA